MRLPANSVRGRVRSYIERHAHLLGDDVLEIGSRLTNERAVWCINRDLAKGAWLGCDMQPGHGVDVVADIHTPPDEWQCRFSGVLCSEVLEHVARPWVALPKIKSLIKPGGWLVVTTLFTFPEHGFPDDYYRFSRSGLGLLLEDAGFSSVATEYAGETIMQLNDHGEPGFCTRRVPLHVFGIGQC